VIANPLDAGLVYILFHKDCQLGGKSVQTNFSN